MAFGAPLSLHNKAFDSSFPHRLNSVFDGLSADTNYTFRKGLPIAGGACTFDPDTVR